MSIAFFEIEPWEEEIIQKRFSGEKLEFFAEPLDEDFLGNLSEVEVLSVFIYSKVSPKILDKLPNLKMIATRSTGFDHIDMKACKEKDIAVTNVPTYGENTVAEHTFALILALSRKITQSAERTQKNDFSLEGLRGFDLANKTIGIIGTGHIGAHVARIANGFEMNILGFDPHQNQELVEKYRLKYTDLDELLAHSDIITLHLPDNEQTHHILDKTKLSQIKRGAYLVNTARGGLIETGALLEAINSEKLAGAGLDVLEEECNIKEERELLSKQFPKKCLILNIANNILLRLPNVIITPHNAFNSGEALRRILDTTFENIQAYKGNKAINLV